MKVTHRPLYLLREKVLKEVIQEALHINLMKKRSDLALLQRRLMNLKNIDRPLRLERRLQLRSTDGRERKVLFMRLLMKVNMYSSLSTRKDMNFLKVNIVGIILMKKVRNTLWDLNQSENG